ncbi:hypothetical protein F442_01319 [Phytophthora nicotianae P10297]|uniref:DNA binding HTH domain-containing protein n=1 Tax=Phytophthora nicotianae P10297 TaxID=1317064 RepID=W3A5M2_PHYNI|nr:hypothetical protein F442_01319 [Phytophthora nicotianae P10297]
MKGAFFLHLWVTRAALELLDEAGSATAAAKALSVHRSSLYRWKNSRKALEDAALKAPNRCYVNPSTRSSLGIRHPALEARLLK